MIPRSDDLYQHHYGPPPDQTVDVNPIGATQPHRIGSGEENEPGAQGLGVQRLSDSDESGEGAEMRRRLAARRRRAHRREPLPPWKGGRVDLLA
jgi:hypothetical protein